MVAMVDAEGNWIMTPGERIIQESPRAEDAEDKAKRLAAKPQELGINPEEL